MDAAAMPTIYTEIETKRALVVSFCQRSSIFRLRVLQSSLRDQNRFRCASFSDSRMLVFDAAQT